MRKTPGNYPHLSADYCPVWIVMFGPTGLRGTQDVRREATMGWRRYPHTHS